MAADEPPRYVIGVDGGTESLRAGVFDTRGRPLAFASSPYPTRYPHPSWAEQDPDDWWDALVRSVRMAVTQSGVDPAAIVSLCCATTCCTVVALDAAGRPLRPAILWMDVRAAEQAARVLATGDAALAVNGGGAGPVSAECMLPKALWLRDNEPGVYAAAATICEYQDALNLRLTGRLVASACTVAVRWHWSSPAADAPMAPPLSLLATLGLESLASKWPQEALPMGRRIGGLTPAAALALGLPVGLAVGQGGPDAFVGMLGLAVTRPGDVALLTGSSHLHLGVLAAPAHRPGVWGTYGHALLPGLHVIEGGQTSTGSVLAWFKRLVGNTTVTDSVTDSVTYATLDAEAALIPPGCSGLIALDCFQGNRTPHTDPHARGALVGLTLGHTRGAIWRALLESVAFGTLAALESLASAGCKPESLALAGGAATSRLWLQIHADVTGLPLRIPRVPDAPSVGAAVLAATCAGVYPTARDAADAMVAFNDDAVVYPGEGMPGLYRPFYDEYVGVYAALSPGMRRRGGGAG